MIEAQKHVAKWLLDNPTESIPLGGHKAEIACALCNLGIATSYDDFRTITLKSADKARQWLNSLEG